MSHETFATVGWRKPLIVSKALGGGSPGAFGFYGLRGGGSPRHPGRDSAKRSSRLEALRHASATASNRRRLAGGTFSGSVRKVFGPALSRRRDNAGLWVGSGPSSGLCDHAALSRARALTRSAHRSCRAALKWSATSRSSSARPEFRGPEAPRPFVAGEVNSARSRVPQSEIWAWLFASYQPFHKTGRRLDCVLDAFAIRGGLFPVVIGLIAFSAALVAHWVSFSKAPALVSPRWSRQHLLTVFSAAATSHSTRLSARAQVQARLTVQDLSSNV